MKKILSCIKGFRLLTGIGAFYLAVFFLTCESDSPEGPNEDNGLLQEIEDPLPNPFKGFAPWIGNENPEFDTRLQYATFAWSDLEPLEGVYNWFRLEKNWGNIAQTGKRVGFRIAAVIPGSGRIDTPEWLIDEGVALRPYSIDGNEGLAPDWDDPKFLEAHHDFITALGARYDSDPRVAWIDIGSYGFWGEWHVWMNDSLAASGETKEAILRDYFEAFPTKMKVIAFDDDYATQYVTERGGGIRNDCLGTSDANDWYLESLNSIDPSMNDSVWKTAIITGEFCGSESGARAGTNTRFDLNFQFVKKNHWSFIGPAGGDISPESETHRQNLITLHKTLGYRFVLRRVSIPSSVERGKSFTLEITVENKGIAPFYFPWPLVMTLHTSDGSVALTQKLGLDIRTWLPGSINSQVSISIPADMKAGTFEAKLSVQDPDFNLPGLYFANTGRDDLGRYRVGSLKVR